MDRDTDADLGQRVRASRKRAGLSQDHLATEIGLDRTAVNRIENGTRRVTALELADIARALNVRMSSFFEAVTPALVAHRSHQGLDTADSQIDILLADLAGEVEFLQSLDVPELVFPNIERLQALGLASPDTHAEAEHLAERVRAFLELSPTEPITNLSESVATLGLLAFSRDIGADTADAGTILLRHGGVCLINSHMKIGRRRLALAHELGHYLSTDEYSIDWRVDGDRSVPTESRLDHFARAILLPTAGVTQAWQRYAAEQDERTAAVRVASEYRVDMATLARRLHELGLVSQDTRDAVRVARTTRADIIELNLHVPLEELEGTSVPRVYSLAVLRLVRDERISRERALTLLQGTFSENDLPPVRQRRADEIWNFVA